MNLQEAGDAPRIRHAGSSQPTGEIMLDGGYISLENGFSQSTKDQLIKMGHKLKYDKGSFGGYQAIMLKDGVYFGASESRKEWSSIRILAPVAQLDRVSGFEPEGREFESSRAHQKKRALFRALFLKV